MGYLLVMTLLGLIPALIANNKGRSFFGWYVYGVLLFIIALVHALIVKEKKKCEFCAELIKAEAKVCRYCSKECSNSFSKEP